LAEYAMIKNKYQSHLPSRRTSTMLKYLEFIQENNDKLR